MRGLNFDLVPEVRRELIASDHALDALLSSLAACAAGQKWTTLPGPEQTALARAEGWSTSRDPRASRASRRKPRTGSSTSVSGPVLGRHPVLGHLEESPRVIARRGRGRRPKATNYSDHNRPELASYHDAEGGHGPLRPDL